MVRKAIRNTLIIAIFLLAPIGANAAFWIITDTLQNGTAYTPGFGQGTDGLGTGAPTLGLVGWFTRSTGGANFNIVGAGASAPGYACYGLTVNGDTTCAAVPTSEIWNPIPVVFSGSINDDLSFMDLSWTGQSGIEIPFGIGQSLFTSTVNSGSYDANGNISGGVDLGAGYDADGFSCWNNPLNGLPGPPDFCGNGTGVAEPPPPPTSAATKAFLELSAGLTGFGGFTNNMDGTITIDLWDSTYTDCINDSGCTPGSASSDVFAQWRVNAIQVVPVPAAIWLFASALGLLGWLRRQTA
jgi:hypothetical protein